MPHSMIEVLAMEHEQLHDLFDRVSSPDEDRPAVLKELMQTMASHLAVEKQMVLPVLKKDVADSGDMCDEMTRMHHRVEHLLVQLDRRKVNSPDVPEMVTEMLDLNESHISQANDVVFPALRNALSPEELDDIGAKMTSDERQMLTHSHPMIPDSGPVATVARKAAQVIDGIRDHSSDIGRTAS